MKKTDPHFCPQTFYKYITPDDDAWIVCECQEKMPVGFYQVVEKNILDLIPFSTCSTLQLKEYITELQLVVENKEAEENANGKNNI